jgi:hypothetical protein
MAHEFAMLSSDFMPVLVLSGLHIVSKTIVVTRGPVDPTVIFFGVATCCCNLWLLPTLKNAILMAPASNHFDLFQELTNTG